MNRLTGLLAAAVIFFVAVGLTPSAQTQEIERNFEEVYVGQELVVRAYCRTEADAKRLSISVAETGDVGYNEVMLDINSKCYDADLLPYVPISVTVTLVERVWSVVHPDGTLFDFWTVKDSRGVIGWAWALTHDDET